MTPDWMIPADLAPGDQKSLQRDWSGMELHEVRSLSDPDFPTAYGALWTEFGSSGELEQAEILARRWEQGPVRTDADWSFYYRMVVLMSGGKWAAVQDETAIVRDGVPGAVVHISHNLVAPEWRRTGLAGWMRALPISTARTLLAKLGRPKDSPITLLAEMEHPDLDSPPTHIRLAAIEKAGYKKIHPAWIAFWQPDFRPPTEIDAGGGPHPVPLSLVLRQVGREHEDSLSGDEVQHLIRALYTMYGLDFRPQDMAPLWAALEKAPSGGESLPLIPPTSSGDPQAP